MAGEPAPAPNPAPQGTPPADPTLNDVLTQIGIGMNMLSQAVKSLPAEIRQSITGEIKQVVGPQLNALNDIQRDGRKADKKHHDRQSWLIGAILGVLIIFASIGFYLSPPFEYCRAEVAKQNAAKVQSQALVAQSQPVPTVAQAQNPIIQNSLCEPVNMGLNGLKIPVLGINCPSGVTFTSTPNEATLVIRK